ncbi:recombinase family protein [Gordonia sp. HY442]|uniref:recombinase family protein n=1 Tax=Gordonia zhenghanii TaxID=2911516 RepID=UPI001F16768C|nr:recombinase family protein [Gordonia zhenghanii]MCF8603267.1 recombinase family protein [Gordonia zhenghanii]
MTKKRAALYMRISQDKDGERLGVDRQLADCRALADRLGWQIAAEFDDNDLSAYSGKRRPGFEKLLGMMEHSEVDAVICWQPDRLYRKLADLVRLLDVADGIEIRTVNGGDLDLSTSTGRMLAGILGSVSSGEVELKAERQRRAFKQMAERGKPKWRKAFGYLDDVHEPDPVTAPAVREAYASLLAGGTLTGISRDWNDRGFTGGTGRPWTPSLVSQFMRSPRNAGLRSHRGEIVGPGTWPGLVDEPTWRAVRTMLDDRQRGRATHRKFLLSRLLVCGKCGHWLTGVHRARGVAYGCTKCYGCTIAAAEVEEFVRELVAARLAMPDAAELLLAEEPDEDASALRGERAVLYARLDEIADERADGLLTGAQAKRATDRITAQLDALNDRMRDAAKSRTFDSLPLGEPAVAAALDALPPDRFRAVLDALAVITVASVGRGHRAPDGAKVDLRRIGVRWR